MPYVPTPRKQILSYTEVGYALDGKTLAEAANWLMRAHKPYFKLEYTDQVDHDGFNLYIVQCADETDAQMKKRHAREARAFAAAERRDAAEFERLSRKFEADAIS